MNILQHIIDHWGAYAAFFTVLGVAFVTTWPPLVPRSFQDWWTWFRGAFQTAVPAARHQVNPTPPEPPAQTK